jgi:uncharacterized protein (DUF1778 family)
VDDKQDEPMQMSKQQRRRKVGRGRGTARVELRVPLSAKRLIQRAMALTGLKIGDLAYEGARHVLDERERMVLAGADRDAFLDAVMNPSEPTEDLVTVLRRHRNLFG